MRDIARAVVVATTSGLRLRSRGLPDRLIVSADPPSFIMDVTRPTLDNTGPDLATLGRDLIPYTGTGAGTTITQTAAATFTGQDFTGTSFKRGAAAGVVRFVDCKFGATWASTQPSTRTACVDMRFSPDAARWEFERCTFVNLAQNGFVNNGILGENFIATRCQFLDFQDNLNVYVDTTRQNLPIRIELAGCYIADASLWWAPTPNVVHPSDTVSHSDLTQMQGGRGFTAHGCYYGAYWSPRIGVGTPRSGSEFVTGVPYTQAEGEAKRAELIAAGTDAPTALMVNIARGDIPQIDFHHNWGGGGPYFLNAAGPFATEPGLTYNFGTIHHNLIKRDQTRSIAGSTVVFGIDTTGVVDYHDNFAANPDWTSSGSIIARTSI